MLKVCISGGPCGGKSRAKDKLMQTFRDRGYKTLFCPETATELIVNGVIPGETVPLDTFQEFVLDKQLAKEKLYDEIAKKCGSEKLIIFYDRGLCDQMAYIPKENFQKKLEKRGITLNDAYSHYDCVLHLITAADGAPEHYVWNDPSKSDVGNNAARSESPEEAIAKDRKTMKAWVGHPHLRIIDNSSDFDTKINNAVSEVCQILGEPVPKEIERKFLIQKPSAEKIENMQYMSKTGIIQHYLTPVNDQTERRIRQRGSASEGFSFYYTEKTKIANGERIENERQITQEEYLSKLMEQDPSRRPVVKDRYCFLHKNQYFEMDIYPFSDKYAILEIELKDMSDKVEMPDLKVIKEVTNDERYNNHTLAQTQKFAIEMPSGKKHGGKNPYDKTSFNEITPSEEENIIPNT